MPIRRAALGDILVGVVLPLAAALLLSTAFLLLVSAPPAEAFRLLLRGALGSTSKQADVLVAWVPLVLAAAGLLLTFMAGQWNIGIEGQIVLGAIGATWAGRTLGEGLPGPQGIALMFLCAFLAGALWGILPALLKLHGGVHEIFGGLGLNFVATALTTFLIFGPWKQVTGGTMSGTHPFSHHLWLPTLGRTRLAPLALLVAVVAIVAVYFALRGTLWGLRLRAMGRNMRAAFVAGVPTGRYMIAAFGLCGGLAGLAGAVQVSAVYHRLVPGISSNYGFLGILVVLLAAFRPLLVPPVALFFAAVTVGSTQLQLGLQLDSSLGGVIQGFLVLSFLFAHGLRQRWAGTPAPGAAVEPAAGPGALVGSK